MADLSSSSGPYATHITFVPQQQLYQMQSLQQQQPPHPQDLTHRDSFSSQTASQCGLPYQMSATYVALDAVSSIGSPSSVSATLPQGTPSPLQQQIVYLVMTPQSVSLSPTTGSLGDNGSTAATTNYVGMVSPTARHSMPLSPNSGAPRNSAVCSLHGKVRTMANLHMGATGAYECTARSRCAGVGNHHGTNTVPATDSRSPPQASTATLSHSPQQKVITPPMPLHLI